MTILICFNYKIYQILKVYAQYKAFCDIFKFGYKKTSYGYALVYIGPENVNNRLPCSNKFRQTKKFGET